MSTEIAVVDFDMADYTPEHKHKLHNLEEKFLALGKRAAEDTTEMCRIMWEGKGLIGSYKRGEDRWTYWAAKHLGVERSMAEKCVAAYEWWMQVTDAKVRNRFRTFGPALLIELKSAGGEVVAEIAQRAESGEKITRRKIMQAKEKDAEKNGKPRKPKPPKSRLLPAEDSDASVDSNAFAALDDLLTQLDHIPKTIGAIKRAIDDLSDLDLACRNQLHAHGAKLESGSKAIVAGVKAITINLEKRRK